ncbi:LysR family transcriptional regulator [Bradyrhizobium forestalis]|uniref:LysR family transcriptional regulator n=1 Tax=Bradyrhizobium forestalis TaxID=1419263 RepID=A0A2M8R5B5_9BRAD|nr:LysR family transcriptional regulator [Bradyrhizobium forestalis]PJG53018.1 LysR family transcriptional regulator [Bradyrhizobium forestalis]
MAFDRLHTFLEVYRRLSMGRAAEALALTQPAVSNQISSLEQEFGFPLFVRSRSGVRPTPAADSLARDIAEHVDALGQTLAERRTRSTALSGLLHIGTPAELFSSVGPRIVGAFLGTDIRIQAHFGGRAFLRQGLEDGSFDLALMASSPPERRFGSERVGGERLLLLAHPQIRDALRGRKVDAQALQTVPFVAYNAELSLIRQYFLEAFQGTCQKAARIVVPDLRNVLAIAAELPMWTVAPDYLALPYVASGRLVEIGPALTAVNPFYLVWPKGAPRTSRTMFARRAVKDALISTGSR